MGTRKRKTPKQADLALRDRLVKEINDLTMKRMTPQLAANILRRANTKKAPK
ncbi:MAG: hypothetical protein Q8K45_21285 [Rubrivivax sp.]|nr:hypothetical protein [Rubrivivax sp.]